MYSVSGQVSGDLVRDRTPPATSEKNVIREIGLTEKNFHELAAKLRTSNLAVNCRGGPPSRLMNYLRSDYPTPPGTRNLVWSAKNASTLQQNV